MTKMFKRRDGKRISRREDAWVMAQLEELEMLEDRDGMAVRIEELQFRLSFYELA
jgi:hypothetical protein